MRGAAFFAAKVSEEGQSLAPGAKPSPKAELTFREKKAPPAPPIEGGAGGLAAGGGAREGNIKKYAPFGERILRRGR